MRSFPQTGDDLFSAQSISFVRNDLLNKDLLELKKKKNCLSLLIKINDGKKYADDV